MRPGLVCAVGNGRVQIKQKLVREAANRGRLPERQTQANGTLQVYSLGPHGFIGEQSDKAAAAGMWPDVRPQYGSQVTAELECRFALANPLDDSVAPLPLRQKREVLFDEVD